MQMNINGLWRFNPQDNLDFSQSGYDDSAWKTMFIPSNWFLGGLDHHGVVWFRHEFRIHPGKAYTAIHFDGVDYFADVYLNGKYLGHHTGYFEPFAFDVTKILQSGKNILAVRVESPYETPGPEGWHLRKRLIKGILNHHDCRPGGGWDQAGQSYNTGGIWNRVYLEQHGSVTIDQVLLRAEMDTQPHTLHLTFTATNRNQRQLYQFNARCTPGNFKGDVQSACFSLELPEGSSIHSIQLPVKDICIWQPWDRGFPHLYNVSVLLDSGRKIALYSSQFGFRTIRVEPGFRWFINGRSYFPRGSNYLPSQWLAETLFPEAANGREHPFGGGPGGDFYVRDVAMAKQANLNLLRVHAHVLPPEFHQACDRAGMLVWQDFPLQWGYSDEPEFHTEAAHQMQAMVAGLYNHPSIVVWCCHNESPWDAPWMAGQAGGIFDPSHNRQLDALLEKIVRDLDPTRYIHLNSGTGDGHVYPGWYVGHWRDFQDAPGAPFITEYGAQGLPVKQTLQRMLPQYGADVGYPELVLFKTWLDSLNKIRPFTKTLVRFGTYWWNLAEKHHWRAVQKWMKGWGIRFERTAYKTIPPVEKTLVELHQSREAWETWRFHDFQPAETFDNGISLGNSLDQFIANSQAYQAHLNQVATECYRLAKYTRVTGIIQFDFTDPWPAVTWSVLDYWRIPKPSFDAMRRSMQPVMPCFQIPEKCMAGQPILLSFCIVNDLLQDYVAATCQWHLENAMGELTSAAFPLDIPSDGISEKTMVTLPSLKPGIYRLLVSVSTSRDVLGKNWYELIVQ
jgi:hypothetical protein